MPDARTGIIRGPVEFKDYFRRGSSASAANPEPAIPMSRGGLTLVRELPLRTPPVVGMQGFRSAAQLLLTMATIDHNSTVALVIYMEEA